MPARSDITNKQFGRLTVLNFTRSNGVNTLFQKEIRFGNLRSGNTKSCGCLSNEHSKLINKKHGHTSNKNVSPEYRAWIHIKSRCYNNKTKDWLNYGGRGIVMSERWLNSFDAFLEDMGIRPSPIHSIDRIDVNGNYEPSNCRWATKSTQCRNTRFNNVIEYEGIKKCVSEWAEIKGLKAHTILARLKRKWPIDKALNLSNSRNKPRVNKLNNAHRLGVTK